MRFFILAALASCGSVVTFNSPQPAGSDDLPGFPKRLQGCYLSLADNSVLCITDQLIQRTYDYEYKAHPLQLDSTTRIFGDTMIESVSNKKTIIRHEGDSLLIPIHVIDTLFQCSDTDVLRKLKGYYFLNTYYGNESWEVQKLQLSRGELIISSVAPGPDIDNLREITETPQDTVPTTHFTVTKKQFKEFVRKGGFSEGERFVRIKS